MQKSVESAFELGYADLGIVTFKACKLEASNLKIGNSYLSFKFGVPIGLKLNIGCTPVLR